MQKFSAVFLVQQRIFLHYVLLFVLLGCVVLINQGIESQKIKPA